MALIDEIVSIEDFIRARYASATFKQTSPLKPASDTFVIQFMGGAPETETAFHFRKDRSFSVIYYADTAADVLERMDALCTALYQTNVIPLRDSARYMRVGSFSLSEPFETDNDKFALIGALATNIRTARDQPDFDKIMHVYSRFQ